MSGSDLMQRLARILLTQHVMPAAATGTEKYASRNMLRAKGCIIFLTEQLVDFSCAAVYPILAEEIRQKQEDNRIPRFSPQDLTYAKNMGRGPKWAPAIIVELSGLLSYRMITNNEVQIGQHVDQLLPKHPTAGNKNKHPSNLSSVVMRKDHVPRRHLQELGAVLRQARLRHEAPACHVPAFSSNIIRNSEKVLTKNVRRGRQHRQHSPPTASSSFATYPTPLSIAPAVSAMAENADTSAAGSESGSMENEAGVGGGAPGPGDLLLSSLGVLEKKPVPNSTRLMGELRSGMEVEQHGRQRGHDLAKESLVVANFTVLCRNASIVWYIGGDDWDLKISVVPGRYTR
ncbi:hypothetical protein PR048_028023 [Dryococelus australis]|uniref:Uncharacterized protein n=1 Tax=Dryococelus australis TaxID=614101 RepID=A0ABQ9GI55_9NEOP|nr:hypothetical protein PR048_028023 [Dryococelus australis]